MDVYYHVKFQPCITSGSKVSRGVQNCTHPRNRMCSDPPPGIGLIEHAYVWQGINSVFTCSNFCSTIFPKTLDEVVIEKIDGSIVKIPSFK